MTLTDPIEHVFVPVEDTESDAVRIARIQEEQTTKRIMIRWVCIVLVVAVPFFTIMVAGMSQ
jgi:hypothetical protein